MKIKQIITLNQSLLKNVSDTPRLDIELLLSFVLNKGKNYLYTWPEEEISQKLYSNFISLVKQREAGRPIAHIIGRQSFWDINLTVTKDTLIPRADTESIIEAIIHNHPRHNNDELNILDLGTGAGAIAITLALIFKSSKIMATDISEKALGIAKNNALKANAINISFLHSDWFNSIPTHKKYNIIVSNPPYISINDTELDCYVKKFEPKIALFSQNDGYADLFRIIEKSKKSLLPKGALYLEHGHTQGEAVLERFKYFNYANIMKIFDLSGKWRGTSAKLN